MKLLYVASRPRGLPTLETDAEITAIQRAITVSNGERVEFLPLPNLQLNQLSQALSDFKPDILHLVTHGDADEKTLIFASLAQQPAALGAEGLIDSLGASCRYLIYINACSSLPIAEKLGGKSTPFAIGTSANIGSDTARDSAAEFYRGLVLGQSIQNAYEPARAIAMAQNPGLTVSLFPAENLNAKKQVLYFQPTIVAKYTSDKEYPYDLGLIGCPRDTIQVIFFTDDEDYARDNRGNLEVGLCTVWRGRADEFERAPDLASSMWSTRAWRAFGDVSIFAAGTTSRGDVFHAKSTLRQALRSNYEVGGEPIPKKIQMLIGDLAKYE